MLLSLRLSRLGLSLGRRDIMRKALSGGRNSIEPIFVICHMPSVILPLFYDSFGCGRSDSASDHFNYDL
jgi:hypothetical protein